MDYGFEYVNLYGIATEEEYPYIGEDESCKASENMSAYEKGISHTDVPQESQSQLYSALKQQPVSIGVDAGTWQFYSGGIYSADDCGTDLDHGVLLVGATPNQYWLVKNSWGADWGESGYIRLEYKNTCGVENSASYPTAS